MNKKEQAPKKPLVAIISTYPLSQRTETIENTAAILEHNGFETLPLQSTFQKQILNRKEIKRNYHDIQNTKNILIIGPENKYTAHLKTEFEKEQKNVWTEKDISYLLNTYKN